MTQAVPEGNATVVGGGAAPLRRPWPKLHLIYFVLALFDLIAVGGGLYLSHRLSTLFEQSVATNDEWSARFVSIWNLGEMASAVNAPGNQIFETRDVAAERQNLKEATARLNAEIDKVRNEISTDVSPAMASHPVRTLTYAEQSLAIMVAHGERTLNEFEKGDIDKAAYSMALMDKSFVALKSRLNDAVKAVREIQAFYGKGVSAQVQSLKNYEYIIGGAIIFMVFCVVIYGHGVGAFMTRKYRELEAAHLAAVEAEAEARRTSEQLKDINEDVIRLNHELSSNLSKLRDAQDELVRKSRLSQLGQLTATVAHELRNPLGAVRTSIYLLDRKLKGKALGVEPQIERINNGVTRCDGIISQLLDFSRTKTLACEMLTFDDWLAKLVEDEAQALPRSVAVECFLGIGDAKVEFDPARMSRVLINLIANASEAMVGKGDDESKFTTTQPTITVRSALTARGVEVEVADNGPGMTADILQKVLEPLFTTKSFGTGLGLPAVEKILEQHGGGLDIASAPGQGARFTAWWPSRTSTQEVA